MDFGQPMVLGVVLQASVLRVVHAALDTHLAPAPEGEVRRLVRLPLGPARGTRGGSRCRNHRVLNLVELLLLRWRPRRGLALSAHARPRRSSS